MKHTEWITACTPPVRTGWYEVRGEYENSYCVNGTYTSSRQVMRFFDSEDGLWYWDSPKGGRVIALVYDSDEWRGLTKEK